MQTTSELFLQSRRKCGEVVLSRGDFLPHGWLCESKGEKTSLGLLVGSVGGKETAGVFLTPKQD